MALEHPMHQTRRDQIEAGRQLAAAEAAEILEDVQPGELLDESELEEYDPEDDTIGDGTEEADFPSRDPDDEQGEDYEDDGLDHEDEPGDRPIPSCLKSLADRCTPEVAAALRTVDVVNDQCVLTPSARLGQRGTPLEPFPLSITPKTGFVELVFDQLDQPIIEIAFFRPDAKRPYLTACLTRDAHSKTRTIATAPAPTQDAKIELMLRHMDKRQTALEQALLAVANASKTQQAAPPTPTTGDQFMQELMRDCMTTMFGGFKSYLGNISQAMGKGFAQAPAAPRDPIASLKKLKAQYDELAEVLGTGQKSEIAEIGEVISLFAGGSKIDKEEAKAIEDRVTAALAGEDEEGDE